jgi:hypothetical protein
MSLINLSLKHGRSLDEARSSLEKAVGEVHGLLKSMVQRTEWSPDRNRVRIDGTGFWVEMTVDAESVHATGDIPFLGSLLGGPIAGGLKQIVEKSFQKKLPG